MAIFGIEVITKFDKYREFSGKPSIDLPYGINKANGLLKKLREAGHYKRFYKTVDSDCHEIDLRDKSFGGSDDKWAENVDLFFIDTHGGNNNSETVLTYNIKKDEWEGKSSTWKLGQTILKWLFTLSCTTISLKNPLMCWNIFEGLHEYCGTYDLLTYTNLNAEEVGKDIAENLTDGHTVANAWVDGITDDWINNFPIVVSAEKQDTWNNSDPKYDLTTLNLDHLPEHGFQCPKVSPEDKYWLCYMYKKQYVKVTSYQIPKWELVVGDLEFVSPVKSKKPKKQKKKK